MLSKILLTTLLAGSIVSPALAQPETKPYVKEQKLTFHPPIMCRESCSFREIPGQLQIYPSPLFVNQSPESLLERAIPLRGDCVIALSHQNLLKIKEVHLPSIPPKML